MKDPFDNNKFSTYNRNTFGECVRKRREQLDFSVRELARKVGMSPIYLSEIERGLRPAPTGTVSRIDYLSILADKLSLTESQKVSYTLMARISRLSSLNFFDDYFIKNPNSLKFFLKSMENNFSDEDWERAFKLVFNEQD